MDLFHKDFRDILPLIIDYLPQRSLIALSRINKQAHSMCAEAIERAPAQCSVFQTHGRDASIQECAGRDHVICLESYKIPKGSVERAACLYGACKSYDGVEHTKIITKMALEISSTQPGAISLGIIEVCKDKPSLRNLMAFQLLRCFDRNTGYDGYFGVACRFGNTGCACIMVWHGIERCGSCDSRIVECKTYLKSAEWIKDQPDEVKKIFKRINTLFFLCAAAPACNFLELSAQFIVQAA